MKHLKSSSEDLHRLFRQVLTVRELAEPLASFDREVSAEKARAFMNEKDFDMVAVRDGAGVVGHVLRSELGEGLVGDHLKPIDPSEVLHENSPLSEVLEGLASGRPWMFVGFLGSPCGIVTLGDLQKAPMRMWLFGLVSLFEMQLLKRIKEEYADGGWEAALTAGRLEEARKTHRERCRKHASTYLVDCLQLGDKATIFKKEKSLLGILRVREGGTPQPVSVNKFKDFMGRIETLRNSLAHSTEIDSNDWEAIAKDVTTLEGFLEDLESSGDRRTTVAGPESIK